MSFRVFKEAVFILGEHFCFRASFFTPSGFATFTNVPFSRFGEGSFDKGIYVRVPLSVFGADSRGSGTAVIRPVQRDGGQRLAVDNPLWEVTRAGRADAVRRAVGDYAR